MIGVGVGVAAVDDDGGVKRLRLGPGRAGPTVGRALLHFLSLKCRVRACVKVSELGYRFPMKVRFISRFHFSIKAIVFIFLFFWDKVNGNKVSHEKKISWNYRLDFMFLLYP